MFYIYNLTLTYVLLSEYTLLDYWFYITSGKIFDILESTQVIEVRLTVSEY